MEALDISRTTRPPVILILHARGNDLCSMRLLELLVLMRADIDRIFSFFPVLIIVWSEVIPRVTWQGARDAGAIERARRTLNMRMSCFIQSLSGVVVRHLRLLRRTDGVHLNEDGLNVFLDGLQDGVQQALYFWRSGGRSPV